jgi:hypothetical protein
MEGKDGVPLRSPRPVMALIATAAISLVMAGALAPASEASTASAAGQVTSIRQAEWWLSALGVTRAWSGSKGAGDIVAVLSDGVDAGQPDLTGSVLTGPDLTGTSQSSGPYFGKVGTGIASLIAGHGHGAGDAEGIIGVAPQAKILSVRVTLPADDPLLATSSVAARLPAAIAAGIRYAVNHQADVIDLPIDPGQPGVSGTGGAPAAAGGSAAEKAAVSYALRHGVVLVAPAGDNGAGSDAANYPAAYRGVIAVGAFNHAFLKAPWTSHRGYVAVTAAGWGVTAAANDGGYQTMNSTSAASAVVAGIVALIRSKFPGLSVHQVRDALITSTVFRPAGGLSDGSGHGTVNAQDALAAAATLAASAANASTTGTSTTAAGPGNAGAGAQPWVAPSTPAASSPTLALERQLIRDAAMAAAFLLLMLLLIGCYTVAGRRRRAASRKAVTAEWVGRQAQSRYPGPAATEADRMLEFFAAPLTAPQRAAAAAPAKPQPTQGLFAPATGRQRGAPPARQVSGERAAPAEAAAWIEYGSASRPVSRRPAVTGTPPWEPAAPPIGELPWTAAPGARAPAGQQAADQQPDSAPLFMPSSAPLAEPDGHTAPQPAMPDAWPGGDVPAGDRHGLPEAMGGQTAGAQVTATGLPVRSARVTPPDVASGPHRAAAPEQPSGPAPHASVPGLASGSPQVTGAGLPLRSPGASVAAPLSPSGSLWERGASQPAGAPTTSGGSLWERGTDEPGGAASPSGGSLWERSAGQFGEDAPAIGGSVWDRRTGQFDAPASAPDTHAGPLGGTGLGGTGSSGTGSSDTAPRRGGTVPPRSGPVLPRGGMIPAPTGPLWERAEPPAGEDQGGDRGSHPIYVWNPGAATENFPALPTESPKARHARQGPDWPAEQD